MLLVYLCGASQHSIYIFRNVRRIAKEKSGRSVEYGEGGFTRWTADGQPAERIRNQQARRLPLDVRGDETCAFECAIQCFELRTRGKTHFIPYDEHLTLAESQIRKSTFGVYKEQM